MVSLTFFFYIFVVLFAIIGAMRGWAKELLVSFSVIVSIFIISVFEKYVPFIRDTIAFQGGAPLYWLRMAIVSVLVFFAYQTPNIPRLAGSNRFVSDKLQDILLGIFLGAINGYLIFGTLWFYMHELGYPFKIISEPIAGTPMGDAALELIPFLAPHWLGTPAIFFAVGIAFVFVLVVFI